MGYRSITCASLRSCSGWPHVSALHTGVTGELYSSNQRSGGEGKAQKTVKQFTLPPTLTQNHLSLYSRAKVLPSKGNQSFVCYLTVIFSLYNPSTMNSRNKTESTCKTKSLVPFSIQAKLP